MFSDRNLLFNNTAAETIFTGSNFYFCKFQCPKQNTASGNTEDGFQVVNSNDNGLFNNGAYGNGGGGIVILDCAGTLISGNNASSTQTGPTSEGHPVP